MRATNRYSRLTQGFGLIELLVSISVMVLVTSVILARHDAFNGATLLRSQAYDVALALREMQLLAVSATNDSSGFRSIYGVTFDTTTPGAYVIFRDDNYNYFYDAGEEFGQQGFLDERFLIDDIRLVGSGGDAGARTDVTVLFERPNFDSLIYKSLGSPAAAGIYAVEIDVRVRGTTGNGAGEVRTIEITRTGQVTVLDV